MVAVDTGHDVCVWGWGGGELVLCKHLLVIVLIDPV